MDILKDTAVKNQDELNAEHHLTVECPESHQVPSLNVYTAVKPIRIGAA